MAEFGFEFWNRVDELRHPLSLGDFSKKVGIPYQTLLNQRSQCRYPKREDIQKIATALNTSIDYLMTGSGSTKQEDQSAERQAILEALDANPRLEKFVLQYIESIKELVK